MIRLITEVENLHPREACVKRLNLIFSYDLLDNELCMGKKVIFKEIKDFSREKEFRRNSTDVVVGSALPPTGSGLIEGEARPQVTQPVRFQSGRYS